MQLTQGVNLSRRGIPVMYGFDLVGNSFKQCFFSRGKKSQKKKKTIKDCVKLYYF